MTTILKVFVLPPGLNFFSLIFGFLIFRFVAARLGICLMAASVVALWFMSLPIVAGSAIRLYDTQTPFEGESFDGDGVIVVLGGRRQSNALEYGGDTVGADTLQRIRYGVKLARELELPVAVTGGGRGDSEKVSLGKLMAQVMESDFGVPARWIEGRSRNTAENAQNLREILPSIHVILVTHSLHMKRAVSVFEAVGFTVSPAPIGVPARGEGKRRWRATDFLPSARALLITRSVLYEVFGSLYYKLRYQ